MKNASYAPVLLVASSLVACAMETTSEPANDDGTVENQITPNDDSFEAPGGISCQPVLVHGSDGQLTVKEWLCPMPQRPLPDPEAHSEGLREDWVSGASRPPGVD
jgi:hypothetical protein